VTLAPLVEPGIRGVKGKAPALPKMCVAPGCISLAQQRHHLWPKSFLRGQPIEWVSVRDRTIPNSVGLCLTHHAEVTGGPGGHRAHIKYKPKLELLEWHAVARGHWKNFGPLRGQALVEPEPEAYRVRREEGLCPTCGRALPHEKPKTQDGLPKRKAKTWTILVPDDAEAGADILDIYITDLGILMGLNADSQRLLRYHVLVPVLEWVNQSKGEFVREWEEAAG